MLVFLATAHEVDLHAPTAFRAAPNQIPLETVVRFGAGTQRAAWGLIGGLVVVREGKIDADSLEIVKRLESGRRSYKEIGLEMGLSEATIRSKVNKMIQEGLVDIKALVASSDLEVGHQTAYIGVRLKSPAVKKIAEAIAELPGVVSVALVTGRYDLILTVMLSPNYGLIEFFNTMLENYSDSIRSNETFLVYEHVNLKIPYPY